MKQRVKTQDNVTTCPNTVEQGKTIKSPKKMGYETVRDEPNWHNGQIMFVDAGNQSLSNQAAAKLLIIIHIIYILM